MYDFAFRDSAVLDRFNLAHPKPIFLLSEYDAFDLLTIMQGNA